MRVLRAVVCVVALALAPTAFAQSSILQAGPMTPGHAPAYATSGNGQPVVQDSGSAGGAGAGVGLSEINITARGTGTPPYASQGTGPNGEIQCIYDAQITNLAGYHYLCFSANAQGGGLMSYGAGGVASALPLQFIVNGVKYQFPFSISGIVGPGSTTAGDVACWNNTAGTLLKDCGAPVNAASNNVWSGTNNFTGPVQVNSVPQTFPASGQLVGTTDVQTLSNKSINASNVNSGTLPGAQTPVLSGDVTTPGGSAVATVSANAITNSKLAQGPANTLKGNPSGSTANEQDVSVPGCSGTSNALQWVSGTGFNCGSLTANSAGFGVNLSGGVFSISSSQPPYSMDTPVNAALTATVNAGALTINLVGANGSAPSATNPVLVPFRSTTLTTGTPVWAAVTSALSITIPSAATLGTANNIAFRVWVFIEYNGGSPELAVATCSSATQIFGCSSWETTRQTSTTISGFATAAGTLYAPAGVANDSFRIAGYVDYASGLAVAGNWASSPTTLQVMGAGVKKPGDIIQTVTNLTGTYSSGSNTYTPSATLPTPAGAQLVATQAITPSSSPNHLRIHGQVVLLPGAAASLTSFIYDTTNSTARSVAVVSVAGSAYLATIPTFYETIANTSSAITYTLYGTSSAGSTYINGNASQWFGSASNSFLRVEEIMGALDAPANDNGGFDLRMVG